MSTQQRETTTRTKEQIPPVPSGHVPAPTTGPVHSANKPLELLIMEDHNEIRQLYKHFQNAATKDDATKWYNQLVWEIARHSVAEEVVLYPIFEDKLGDWGKQRADLSR